MRIYGLCLMALAAAAPSAAAPAGAASEETGAVPAAPAEPQ